MITKFEKQGEGEHEPKFKKKANAVSLNVQLCVLFGDRLFERAIVCLAGIRSGGKWIIQNTETF